jgi:hypothetical protein
MDLLLREGMRAIGSMSRANQGQGGPQRAEAAARVDSMRATVRNNEVAVLDGEIVPRSSSRAARRAEPIDGAELLNFVRGYLARYVAWPSEAALNMTTVWIAHAVARDRDDTGIGPLIWRASPRLLATSKVRGSGKSTLLDLIVILTRSRGKVPKLTPAKIAEIIGRHYETVVLDEAKTIFGTGSKNLELQGILLAGYTPRSRYEVAGKSLSLFGAVAYAGKDELITEAKGEQIGDLLDRSIIIRMRKPARMMPEAGEQAEDEGDLIAGALVAWTNAVRAELKQAARDIADEEYKASMASDEDGGNMRTPQIWRPLKAVARAAGGHWAEDIDASAEELMEGAAGVEAEDVMAELRKLASLRDADPGDLDDEPGVIVTGPGDDEDD